MEQPVRGTMKATGNQVRLPESHRSIASQAQHQ